MIKIHQISKINIQNDYFYIFDKRYGNGRFNNSYIRKGDGFGFGSEYGFFHGFGYPNGNGCSHFSNFLIENYKND